MAGKASTFWPNGEKPAIGDTALGTEIGRLSRGRYTWSACPGCGLERWVAKCNTAHSDKPCMSCAAVRRDLIGEKNPRWKGGVRQGADGYRYISVPEDHPLIEMAGRVFVHGKYRYYIAEHRIAMAEKLGRPLLAWELVHHLDGTKDNNDPDNLELMSCVQEHLPSMNVQRIVSQLQQKVVLLEAEVARMQSLLEDNRDGVTRNTDFESKAP